MYVCICHAISEKEVEEAKQAGVGDGDHLFSHFGVAPKCGRCAEAICDSFKPSTSLTQPAEDGKDPRLVEAPVKAPDVLKKSS